MNKKILITALFVLLFLIGGYFVWSLFFADGAILSMLKDKDRIVNENNSTKNNNRVRDDEVDDGKKFHYVSSDIEGYVEEGKTFFGYCYDHDSLDCRNFFDKVLEKNLISKEERVFLDGKVNNGEPDKKEALLKPGESVPVQYTEEAKKIRQKALDEYYNYLRNKLGEGMSRYDVIYIPSIDPASTTKKRYEPPIRKDMMFKPVIYLYPQKVQDVYVGLNCNGKIIADYPSYDHTINGWNVTAYPDGKVVNKADGKEYSYIFWEGETQNKINWDLSRGFVVKGEDTRDFLQKTLSRIGLTPKEYNEFIVYWYPKMKNNKYNLIHFADKQYTQTAELKISPEPDSILRVFMVYKPLDNMVNIEPQEIKSFERKGFVVVEWGGTEVISE